MKPTDDTPWTEVEQRFFAAAPPEEPEPFGEPPSFDDLPAPAPQRPRREIIARAGGHVQRAWRGAALFVRAAGVSIRRVDRRGVALALAGAIVAAGLTAGGVAFRKGAPTQGATAEREAPSGDTTIVEAAPDVAPASHARVAHRPNVGTSADVPTPRAVASNRHPHDRRRAVPASAAAQRPLVTASMDRETYWASEHRSAAARSSRPLFSR